MYGYQDTTYFLVHIWLVIHISDNCWGPHLYLFLYFFFFFIFLFFFFLICICMILTSLLGILCTTARTQFVAFRVQPAGEASTTNTASLSSAQTLSKWRPWPPQTHTLYAWQRTGPTLRWVQCLWCNCSLMSVPACCGLKLCLSIWMSAVAVLQASCKSHAWPVLRVFCKSFYSTCLIAQGSRDLALYELLNQHNKKSSLKVFAYCLTNAVQYTASAACQHTCQHCPFQGPC